MGITVSVLDGYDLPVQFKYRFRQPKRTSYLPTIEDGIIRAAPAVVAKDTLVNFEIRDVELISVVDILRTKYEAVDNPTYTFVGHRDTSAHDWNVKFEDFEDWLDEGLYQIRGILRIVS